MTTRPAQLRRRMAASDTIFWYAESALPRFRPVIAGLFELDGAPTLSELAGAFARAVDRIPRLHQRVVEAPAHLAPPEWLDDPHFDLDYHLRRLALPAPGDRRQLLELAGSLLATPLDRERPLWEATVLEGLEGGRAACLLKLHHALADGVGALALLDSLTQPGPQRPGDAPRRAPATPDGLGERLAALALDAGAHAFRLTVRALRASGHAVADPPAAAREGWRFLRGIGSTLVDLTAGTVRDPLAATGAGLSRRLDTLAIPLERLDRIREPLGVTLNDLLLAAFAGALGAYHRERGVSVRALRCLVPMNLRGHDDREGLGNRVGLFSVRLPISETDRHRRLRAVERQTGAAKRDRRGESAPFLMEAVALLPGAAFRWLAQHSLGRVNVICSNIPGPHEPRDFAGRRVLALYPFAPVAEGTPVAVAALSYAGALEIGIDTDRECIPEPERIGALLEAEIEAYAALGSGRNARGTSAARPSGTSRRSRHATPR